MTHWKSSTPPPSPSASALLLALREPVVLVTHGRGREVYRNSVELFKRLTTFDTARDCIRQVQHEGRFLAEASVEALNTFLATPNAWSFFRRQRISPYPIGAVASKYTWRALITYLGGEWHT